MISINYVPNEVTERTFGPNKIEDWTDVLSAINCNKYKIVDKKCESCNTKLIHVEIYGRGLWGCCPTILHVCMPCKKQFLAHSETKTVA
jgi:hypothetical protein